MVKVTNGRPLELLQLLPENFFSKYFIFWDMWSFFKMGHPVYVWFFIKNEPSKYFVFIGQLQIQECFEQNSIELRLALDDEHLGNLLRTTPTHRIRNISETPWY